MRIGRREFVAGALAAPMVSKFAFASEASSVNITMQHGLPYLPLMVMDRLKLVEKHAEKAGVPGLTASYSRLGGTSSLIDALLSGQMHFGVTGVPGLITLWNKTVGTANEVRALSAVQSMPYVLVTNNPAVKSLGDFSDNDKIAVPSVKVSSQAVCLQMAAAKEWGMESYDRLDGFTITRPHPDAATAVISGGTEITSHYAAAPFYYYELAAPTVREVLKSYDTLGGPTTNGVMIMSKTFGDENPKTSEAVYAALTEANDFINANPGDAATIYIEAANEKRATQGEMEKMVADPDNVWTTTPQNSMKYLEFMLAVGTIKNQPSSWKDLYMPVSHELPGS